MGHDNLHMYVRHPNQKSQHLSARRSISRAYVFSIPHFFAFKCITREQQPEFNFLKSKYERTGFSRARPRSWARVVPAHVLAFVLCAHAYARARKYMHVCVCIARRLLLPVSSLRADFLREDQFRGLSLSLSRGSLTDDKWQLRELVRNEAVVIVKSSALFLADEQLTFFVKKF